MNPILPQYVTKNRDILDPLSPVNGGNFNNNQTRNGPSRKFLSNKKKVSLFLPQQTPGVTPVDAGRCWPGAKLRLKLLPTMVSLTRIPVQRAAWAGWGGGGGFSVYLVRY